MRLLRRARRAAGQAGRCGLARVVGWRCYSCWHWPAGAYYVYVVELGNGGRYVGQSALYPAERFSQHLTGYKAAVVHGMGGAVWLFGEVLPVAYGEEPLAQY